MWYFAITLVAVVSFFLGHFLREVKELLVTIKNTTERLRIAQDANEQKAKGMGLADPAEFNWDQLDDQEKINFLNS